MIAIIQCMIVMIRIISVIMIFRNISVYAYALRITSVYEWCDHSNYRCAPLWSSKWKLCAIFIVRSTAFRRTYLRTVLVHNPDKHIFLARQDRGMFTTENCYYVLSFGHVCVKCNLSCFSRCNSWENNVLWISMDSFGKCSLILILHTKSSRKKSNKMWFFKILFKKLGF